MTVSLDHRILFAYLILTLCICKYPAAGVCAFIANVILDIPVFCTGGVFLLHFGQPVLMSQRRDLTGFLMILIIPADPFLLTLFSLCRRPDYCPRTPVMTCSRLNHGTMV